MLRLLILVQILGGIIFSPLYSISHSPRAKAYLLMNADTGAIISSKNIDRPLYPASLTKVATALYILDQKYHTINNLVKVTKDSIGMVSLKQKIKSGYTLPSHWIERGGTHISLHAGESFSMIDLLNASLIASANDAANVMAKHISGSVPEFMSTLNDYLRSIGCTNTNFTNPHGLHHPDHKSTARDLAIMARKAMRYPEFRHAVSQKIYQRKKTAFHKAATYPQSNRLMRTGKYYYSNAIGMKTGYHSLTKYSLIAAAENGNRSLILVLLGCDSLDRRFNDAIKIFETTFKEAKARKVVLKKGKKKAMYLVGREKKPIYADLKNDVNVEYYPSEEVPLEGVIAWKSLSLPISQGDVIGEILVREKQSQSILQKAPLFASQSVDKGFWTSILDLISNEE